MNKNEIETFNAVVKYKSFASAAKHLYISQASCSQRIMNLENELNYKLFYRQKGLKQVELTNEGERFIPIAKRLLNIFDEASELKKPQNNKLLRIGGTDTINTFLVSTYSSFIKENKDINIKITTNHSSYLHQSIDSNEIDIAFVSNLHNFPSINSYPFIKEGLFIVCSKKSKYVQTLNMKDLNIEDEIVSDFSQSFRTWHIQNIGNIAVQRVITGTQSMIGTFLEGDNCWSIVSGFEVEHLLKSNANLVKMPIKNNPPTRIIYLIINKDLSIWKKELVDCFVNYCLKHLTSDDIAIKLMDKWQ